jgi:transposase
MPRISNMIDDKTYEDARFQLKMYGNTAKISVKLRAIVAAKKHGISNVAEVFDITRKSLMKWINDFKSKGADQLKIQVGRGRKPMVNKRQLEKIKGWILLNPNITTRELMIKINNTMKLNVSMSTVGRILKKIGIQLYNTKTGT